MWYIIVYMLQDDYEKKRRARENSVLVIKKLVRGKETSRGQQPIWNYARRHGKNQWCERYVEFCGCEVDALEKNGCELLGGREATLTGGGGPEI
jgi:hypothetical protein